MAPHVAVHTPEVSQNARGALNLSLPAMASKSASATERLRALKSVEEPSASRESAHCTRAGEPARRFADGTRARILLGAEEGARNGLRTPVARLSGETADAAAVPDEAADEADVPA
eukprot:2808072-Pleurochrysis_carterae.AAC.1